MCSQEIQILTSSYSAISGLFWLLIFQPLFWYQICLIIDLKDPYFRQKGVFDISSSNYLRLSLKHSTKKLWKPVPGNELVAGVERYVVLLQSKEIHYYKDEKKREELGNLHMAKSDALLTVFDCAGNFSVQSFRDCDSKLTSMWECSQTDIEVLPQREREWKADGNYETITVEGKFKFLQPTNQNLSTRNISNGCEFAAHSQRLWVTSCFAKVTLNPNFSKVAKAEIWRELFKSLPEEWMFSQVFVS